MTIMNNSNKQDINDKNYGTDNREDNAHDWNNDSKK